MKDNILIITELNKDSLSEIFRSDIVYTKLKDDLYSCVKNRETGKTGELVDSDFIRKIVKENPHNFI